MKNHCKLFTVKPIALATASLLPVAFASSGAWAQAESSGSSAMLEEVIVTAQKKAENVQDIPATVNAISAEALVEFSILQFDDVAALAPGVELQQADARRQTITIRGVTADPDNVAKQPITTYVNEVPVRQQIIFSALYDMERIEILRGPQGTLQGRTDPAGSILTYTRKPSTSEWDGYVQQTFSDNHGSNTQFGASLPAIKDKLAFRVAGLYDDNEGQEYRNTTTGQEQHNRTKSARLTMDWLATDNLEFVLTYGYTERDVGFPEPIQGDWGGYSTLTNPPTVSPVTLDPNYPRVIDKEDRLAIHQGVNSNDVEINLASLQMDWDLGPGSLTWTSGFYDIQQDNILNRDISNVYPLPFSQQTLTDLQYYSQELRFASNEGAFDGFWDYLVGAFWERTDTQTRNIVDASGRFGLFGVPVEPGQAINDLDIPIERENLSFYTHNTLHFTDSFNMQFGLRYQDASIKTRADNTWTNTTGVGPDSGESCLIPDGTCPTVANDPSTITPEDLTSQEDDAVTGSIKLSWFALEQTMFYGSLDSSYRPPGVTVTPTPVSAENLFFDKETSTAFELGFKSTFANNRVRLNGAWFYQKYDGYQARAVEPSVTFYNPAPRSEKMQGGLTYNADATVQGVELELQSLITDRWTLGGGAAYVDGRFDDGETGPCNRPLTAAEEAAMTQVAECDIGGERVSAQPLFSGNLTTEWYLPVGPTEWYIRGLYNYRSESSSYLVEDQTIPSYGTLNVWTGIRSTDAKWDVNLWAKNVTDEQQLAVLSNREFQDDLGVVSNWRRGNMIQPRTVGLTARFNW